jgi:hypothetical protein
VPEPESRLDPDLVKFLEDRIATVEDLEVLLLVSSSPEHWWTVRAVNDLLRSREDSIKARLKELCDKGLLEQEPNEESYRLRDNPALQDLMQRLRTAYKTFRVRVIEMIYAPKRSPLAEFSRAFDLKRPKQN